MKRYCLGYIKFITVLTICNLARVQHGPYTRIPNVDFKGVGHASAVDIIFAYWKFLAE
jgi:hypothetical protein